MKDVLRFGKKETELEGETGSSMLSIFRTVDLTPIVCQVVARIAQFALRYTEAIVSRM